MTKVLALIAKEFRLDWKSNYALGSLLLYVLSTGYVVFLAFQRSLEPTTWNAVLWIIILFASFNTVTRAFDQDSGHRGLYLFSLASAQTVILAKMIYNALLMTAVSVVSLAVFSFFIPIDGGHFQTLYFLLGVALGSIGLSTILTLIAGIAWKSGGKNGMTAILGFPLILPLLLAAMRYSDLVIRGTEWPGLWRYALAISMIACIGGALAYLLFPYIWKE